MPFVHGTLVTYIYVKCYLVNITVATAQAVFCIVVLVHWQHTPGAWIS